MMEREESFANSPDHITPPSDHQETSTNNKKAKDASRPKRKKARRACLACQRAHLTCGDERPCDRCVKRGLQDSCHNGMRKKAKYLHDAPDEVLGGEIIKSNSTVQKNGKMARQENESDANVDSMQHAAGLYSPSTVGYSMTPRRSTGFEDQQGMPAFTRLNSSATNATMPDMSFNTGLTPSANVLQQSTQTLPQMTSAYDPTFFDANDPNLYFDTADLNFSNEFGAQEFGILGHMSSGAGANDMFMRPPNRHQSFQFDQSGLNSGFLPLNGSINGMNARSSVTDWQTNPVSQGLTMNSWNPGFSGSDMGLRHDSIGNEPNAFTIGAVPGAFSTESPASSIDYLLRYDDGQLNTNTDVASSANALPLTGFLPLTDNRSAPPNPQMATHHRKHRSRASGEHPLSQSATNTPSLATRKVDLSRVPLSAIAPASKRHRDPSTVYTETLHPYPYTIAFHALTSVLQRRFPAPKRLVIAQALASIRPSFISCTRTLIDDDLVFMEKCFQRQLLEYEEFIAAVGTPTVICRRTGEVAGVGKEFCLLTGWERNVLLGAKPNENANVGPGGGGSATGTTSRRGGALTTGAVSTSGVATPRVVIASGGITETAGTTTTNAENTEPTVTKDNKDNATTTTKDSAQSVNATGSKPAPAPRKQPVFLAELLDDDSVIRFYEDFAKLAFADVKGSAWSPCKLLKYRTKEEMLQRGLEREKRREEVEAETELGIGIERRKELGKREEKEDAMDVVNCMYCWTVKRDVFDIPMMIVINVSCSDSGDAIVVVPAADGWQERREDDILTKDCSSCP